MAHEACAILELIRVPVGDLRRLEPGDGRVDGCTTSLEDVHSDLRSEWMARSRRAVHRDNVGTSCKRSAYRSISGHAVITAESERRVKGVLVIAEPQSAPASERSPVLRQMPGPIIQEVTDPVPKRRSGALFQEVGLWGMMSRWQDRRKWQNGSLRTT